MTLLPTADIASLQQGQALTLPTRIGPVELAASHILPLLQALESSAKNYAELAALPAYSANPGALNPLLQALAWAGWLHFQGPDTAPSTEPPRNRIQHLQQAWQATHPQAASANASAQSITIANAQLP